MVLFCTTPFTQMARALLTTLGTPNLRIVEIAHPLGGLQQEAVRSRAVDVTDTVLELLHWHGKGE